MLRLPVVFPLLFACLAGCEVQTGPMGGPITIVPGEARDRGAMGVEFDSSRDDITGAVVANVIPGSTAEQSGIRVGDIIQQVDGIEVQSAEHLLRQAKGWKPNQVVAVSLLQDGQEHAIEVELLSIADLIGLRAAAERPDEIRYAPRSAPRSVP